MSELGVVGNGSTTITLSNGVRLPLVGFGCAGKLTRVPISSALAAGYTLFDTSQAPEWYSEEELGEAEGANGFVATKNNTLDAESGFNWRQCKSEVQRPLFTLIKALFTVYIYVIYY